MSIATLREAMLWSLVINYGVLLIWFAAFTWGHDRLFRLHSRWFQMSRDLRCTALRINGGLQDRHSAVEPRSSGRALVGDGLVALTTSTNC